MTMLQSYSSQQPVLYDNQAFDLAYLINVIKRRILYFAIPFLLIVMLGSAVVEIQRPIYRAEGKILVESPEIPSDLVRPTVTEVAEERIQVIKQRIMTRDNLLAVVNKYDLFPHERVWMSGTELLDLMRERIEIKPVLETQAAIRPTNPTIAFTLTFDYEVPDTARKVANEFLTSILSEDASARTNNATETTKFLEREVKRLQGEHEGTIVQIEAVKQRPVDREHTVSEEVKAKTKALAELENTLVQKSSIYSDEHPEVKSLKKKVAALRRALAAVPRVASAQDKTVRDEAMPPAEANLEVLERQQIDLERNLEDTNRKLTAARLGESMERGQQAERLRVIEHPSLPQKPVRPQKLKWFAVAFALAGIVGAGTVFGSEMLDSTIRDSRGLAGVVDRDLIVSIPYISTPGEERRRRRNVILICTALVIVCTGTIATLVALGVSIDFSLFDRSWIDILTRLLR